MPVSQRAPTPTTTTIGGGNGGQTGHIIPYTLDDLFTVFRDALVDSGAIQDPFSAEVMDGMARAHLGADAVIIGPGIMAPLEPLPIPPGLPLTDMGNAERLKSRYGRDLRYCPTWGQWLIWDGRRWAEDQLGRVELLAMDTIRNIYQEAADEPDKQTRAALVAHAVRSESAPKRHHLLDSARAMQAITPADLDADPWLLNCRNGILDLHTGQLQAHRREALLTKLCPVEYDPAARLDLWERFLATATDHNDELIAFLRRAVGYTLTGDTSEEVLLFVHGPAATGKSTFLEAIKSTLGDYARTADFESFLQRRDVGNPRPDIARLAGARMVTSIEVSEGRRLAEGLIKMLTGGDTITARRLYQTEFEFAPMFKLWLAANHAPKIKPDDEAMWRRILRVPFEAVIPPASRDPLVKATLRDPAQAGPAILNWAVAGCRDWQAHGLGICPAVKQATAALRAEMDPLREFLDTCCQISPTAWTPTAELRAEYEAWCKEIGERPTSGKWFTESLRANGGEPCSGRNHAGRVVRGWLGIGLQLHADEEAVALVDTLTAVDTQNGKVANKPPSRGLLRKDGQQPSTVNNKIPVLCRYWGREHTTYWKRPTGEAVCATCRPAVGDTTIHEMTA